MLKFFYYKLLIVILTLAGTTGASAVPLLVPNGLKCEQLKDPMGIDVEHPVFSYILNCNNPRARGIHQSAYQIWVSASQRFEHGGDIWDTKIVKGDQMANITYQGAVLKSSSKYWWKVRVWDQNGRPSSWSEPASWITGLFNNTNWKASWITAQGTSRYAHVYKSQGVDFSLRKNITEMREFMPKPGEPNFSSLLLRKDFTAKNKITSAIIHISGLGQYELSVNGNPVTKDILSPGWSDYAKTVLYDTYDITDKLTTGANTLGAILGNSLYNIQPDSVRYVKFLRSNGPLKLMASLTISYADGTQTQIGTDESWQVSPGPITYSNYYGGEDYDKRLVQDGWNHPGFKPKATWPPATLTETPGGKLKGLSAAAPPIRKIEELLPVNVNQIKPNLLVYDLGQNTSVMPEVKVVGEVGASIRIIPSELLKPDGTVDRTSATQGGVRPAWWQYTIGSGQPETWFPKFFYQGGRYLQVELIPAEGSSVLPRIEKLIGVVVHSSAAPVGNFSCSNELFNRIYSLVRWAQRSNMMSVLTDCPQREKLGWLEQYHLNGPSIRYNYDLTTLFSKIMNDMADSQLPNGLVPNIAPEYFTANPSIKDGIRNSPEWGSSFIIVPWQQYLFSGDPSLFRKYYGQMKRYVSFLDSTSKDKLIYTGLGDWYDIGPKPAWGSQLTPVEFTGTVIYFYDCQLMSKMAALLGLTSDVKFYEEKAKAIRDSFNKKFFDQENVTYSTGSNTTLAMPLFFGIVEPKYRKKLIETLISDIRKRDNSFTSGEVGYRFLLGALADEGHSEVIFDMNNQTDRPGYGYQLKKGATALTEKWDAGVGSFGSQNHFMSGQINEWFFGSLVGIKPNETGPGFRKFTIKPEFLHGLDWVKGSLHTASGLISSKWQRNGNRINLILNIPVNITVNLIIPSSRTSLITENGHKVAEVKGIKLGNDSDDTASFKLGSGKYNFLITQKPK